MLLVIPRRVPRIPTGSGIQFDLADDSYPWVTWQLLPMLHPREQIDAIRPLASAQAPVRRGSTIHRSTSQPPLLVSGLAHLHAIREATNKPQQGAKHRENLSVSFRPLGEHVARYSAPQEAERTPFRPDLMQTVRSPRLFQMPTDLSRAFSPLKSSRTTHTRPPTSRTSPARQQLHIVYLA
jgi:hypothetical protein